MQRLARCFTKYHFSNNQSVNASTWYSPHESVFGHRPHLPLTAAKPTYFDTIPLDARTYVQKHADKLGIIRTDVRNNMMKSQEAMLARTNEPRHEISNNVVCATSKASDQPAHTRSLIRSFASRLAIL